MVIGGNFLHGCDIKMQLTVAKIEHETKIPLRFRFPFFSHMQWYAAEYYLSGLSDPKRSFTKHEIENIKYLSNYLSKIANKLKNTKS